ncbi:MAG: exodeoxyribonuclease VII large subunit [Verrucomicrobia bacterium]|nr:exodeoxyribonuclease VII large subunit [Verrucomicrobiota bacterium]
MEEILSVSELTSAIKNQLEPRFPAVHVKGEISNLKEQASGHFYFTLKDLEAQVSAVLFRGNARDLSRPIKNGDQVVLHGQIIVYAPRGYYQIVVRKLDYLGVGELLVQLHALKAKLEKQGWFESSRKKKLPKYPRTIGVVTSPTGSVIQDILHVLGRRFAGFHLILNPVKVQGEGAAEEIAKAIGDFNRHRLADVLIVGRGGGSLEDLWAFNEEKVAAAIHQSKIPVISAVGHETDITIADFVADVRAPTPSAAAEIATQETAQQIQHLTQSKNRLRGIVLTLLQHHRKQIENFRRHPTLSTPLSLIEPHLQRIDDLRSDLNLCLKRNLQEKQLQLLGLKKQALALKPSNQIHALSQKLAVLSRSLHSSIAQRLSAWKSQFDKESFRHNIDQRLLEQIRQKQQRLTQLASHLKGIDPKNLLTKGYCILFQEKKDSVILSTRELKEEDKVRLQFHDGKALLTVNGIEK